MDEMWTAKGVAVLIGGIIGTAGLYALYAWVSGWWGGD